MMIDHHRAMVECNRDANIIIPSPFYVEDLTKLADDNNYLRSGFWPLLEVLCDSLDVQKHGSVLHNTKQAIGDQSRNVHVGGRTTRSSKMKLADTSFTGHPPLSG